MNVLHAGWLAASGRHERCMAFWAETSPQQRKKPRVAGGVRLRAHPFALTVPALREMLIRIGVHDPKVENLPVPIIALLPSADGSPLPSPALDAPDAPPQDDALAITPWRVEALALPAHEGAVSLLDLASVELPPDLVFGDDLRFWLLATRFVLSLVQRQCLFPAVTQRGNTFYATWQPLLDDPEEAERFQAVAAAMPSAGRALSWAKDAVLARPADLLRDYLAEAVDGIAREAASAVPPQLPGNVRRLRGPALGDRWALALHGDPLIDGTAEELAPFAAACRTWASVPANPAVAGAFRLCFRLDPPAPVEDSSEAAGDTTSGTSDGPLPSVAEDPGAGAITDAPGTHPESAPATPVAAPSVAAAPPRAGWGMLGWSQPFGATSSAEDGTPPGAAPAAKKVAPPVRRRTPPPAPPAPVGPPWTLQYLLQATDDPSLLVPLSEVWQQRGATARFLNRRFDQPQERVLAGLGRATQLFPALEPSLRASRPESSTLTTAQAQDFLREKALLLRASGFGVLVPNIERSVGLRLTLGKKASGSKGRGPGVLGWDTLVSYDWQLALGDQLLSRAEFEQLAALKEPLVQVRGQWVELGAEAVQQALALLKRPHGEGLSMAEALSMALAPDAEAMGLPIAAVETEGTFDDLLERLGQGAGRQELAEPPGFIGTLRPYQRAGLSWLVALGDSGLGACLADDMGLGKTVQLIATLLHRRLQPDTPPTLLVCPTSVVGNWRRELARFAPELRVLIHHGAGRERERFAEEAARHDVVISSYALLPRDQEMFSAIIWDALVLDEAQNIKNPVTKAAQAARALPARWRVALTGTPVENRLDELWSIFQFINPGYLGSAERFRKRFALPIERTADAEATRRLKALVGPFILRRLKTDRSIIQDLPEKNEMKVFCTLTREQATLYEAALREGLKEIAESDGIGRRGQILAVLTKLKQICDHPALFLHDGSALPGRSGKLGRLQEMLEEVIALDDKALLFTQYAQMGTLLKGYLEATFGREVLFLSGSTPAAERDRMVARFQAEGKGPQLFVLSIKAGGTGLNLTRANHVFHFDRWWNPAVENQATDRAFRIGQRRDVQVHKYICAGTFEEKLDEIIERKQALSESIVGGGESWITEMSTESLRDLFALRLDAVAEG